MSARVLVTGAGGLIGSHVVSELAQRGYEPLAMVHRSPNADRGEVRQIRGDVLDRRSLATAMDGCEAVIHTAAVYSYARAQAPDMAKTNVQGTRNVLDVATRAGVARVVVTSSAATCGPVAGRPADERDHAPAWELKVPYKASKVAAERLALARAAGGQDVVIVNPTTTVGAGDHKPTPSGRMVKDVLDRRISGYITKSGLNVVAAADVARGHVLALTRGRPGERYLLGGDDVEMGDLFALIADLGGVSRPRLSVPYPLALAAAGAVHWLGAVTGREPTLMVLDEVRLARLPMYFSSAKARRELGYTARPAAEAIAAAVTYFKTSARPAPARAGVRRARRGFAT